MNSDDLALNCTIAKIQEPSTISDPIKSTRAWQRLHSLRGASSSFWRKASTRCLPRLASVTSGERSIVCRQAMRPTYMSTSRPESLGAKLTIKDWWAVQKRSAALECDRLQFIQGGNCGSFRSLPCFVHPYSLCAPPVWPRKCELAGTLDETTRFTARRSMVSGAMA